MAFQNGWLRRRTNKQNDVWLFYYNTYVDLGKGKRQKKPTSRVIGPVSDFPTEDAARVEVSKRGWLAEINENVVAGNLISYAELAQKYFAAKRYLDAEPFNKRRLSNTASAATKIYLDNYIVPKFGKMHADSIKPNVIFNWLGELQDQNGLAGPTVSKIKAIMHKTFAWGQLQDPPLCRINPCAGLRLEGVDSDYVAIDVSTDQAIHIIRSLEDPRHKILVLLCAICGLRASEACGLQWQDVKWSEGEIKIERRFAAGRIGPPKTKASRAAVPLHPVLASLLQEWRKITAYAKDTDYILPSLKLNGTKPMTAGIFVTDYLREAALEAGVEIKDGQQFGLHNFRHALATWLVSIAKVDPKTAQGMLRHADVTTTLNKYAQTKHAEAMSAQGRFLDALGLKKGEKLLDAANT